MTAIQAGHFFLSISYRRFHFLERANNRSAKQTNMATTTLPKGSSRKGTRVGAIGDLKGHKNPSKSSNDGSDDDSRCEEMAPDGQNVETSPKSRNPGKVKVDPAFEDLSSTAQEFLRAQGITSALNLMATNAKELVPAWIEWNKEEGTFFKTSNTKATSDVRLWKRKVRERWYSTSTKDRAGDAVDNSLVVGTAAPTVEVVPALHVYESEARDFLIAQGIASAEAFLLSEAATMANALMQWRDQSQKEALGFGSALNIIYRWKRNLRELSGQLLVEQDAELQTLSPMARHFLSSQGIATAEAFPSMKVTTTAKSLMDWRNQWDSRECTIAAARWCISNWRRRLREQQSNRQEASHVLHPVSDVLSSIISDWQKALQERITGTERMHGALSHSTTPSVVSASPNDSRLSLCLSLKTLRDWVLAIMRPKAISTRHRTNPMR
jgi:hypothetical protein